MWFVSSFSCWNFISTIIFINFFVLSSSSSLNSTTCSDPIACALASINIPLPNISIPLLNSNFTISNFDCLNFFIASLPSTYTYPTTVSFGLKDGSLECSGSYIYGSNTLVGPSVPHGSLDLSINSLTVDVSINMFTNEVLPQAFLTTCTVTQPVVTVIAVTGSLKPTVIDALVFLLEKTLDTVLTKVFCDDIANFIAVNGTKALLNTVDPALQQIIDAGSISPIETDQSLISKYSTSLTSEWVNWNELFSSTQSSSPSLVDLSCLRKTAPEILTSLERPLIDQLVNTLTNGTGTFNIPVNKVINIGKDTLTINSVILTGLNSFSDISLFQPSETSNFTINSDLKLQNFGLALNISFYIPPSVVFPYPYIEWLILEADISNTSLSVETVFGVNKHTFEKLYVSQLTDLSCLYTTLEVIDISSLQLFTSIDKFVITQVHGGAMQLENDIVNLIDNTLSLIFAGYSTLVTELITGIMQSEVRTSLNSKISTHIASKKSTNICHDNCPKNEENIVWYNSTLIKTIDFIVNGILGPSGMNKLIRCATGGTSSILIGNDKLNIQVSGLDSFSYLSILEPYSPKEVTFKPYNLLNRLSIGACSGRSCNPLTLTISFKNSGSHSGSSSFDSDDNSVNSIIDMLPVSMQNSLNTNMSTPMTIRFSNLLLYVDLILEVSQDMLCHLHISELSTTGCLKSTVQMLSLSTLQISSQETVMNRNYISTDITDKTNSIFTNLGSKSGLKSINSKLQSNIDSANATCLGQNNDSSSTSSLSSAGDGINTTTGPTVNYWLVPVITTIAIFFLAAAYHYYIRIPYVLNRQSDTTDSLNKGVEGTNSHMNMMNSNNNDSYFIQLYNYLISRKWQEAIIFNEHLNFFLRVYMVAALSVIFVMLRLGLKDLDLLTVMIEIVSPNKSQSAVVTYENNYVDCKYIFLFFFVSAMLLIYIHTYNHTYSYTYNFLCTYFSIVWGFGAYTVSKLYII